MIPLRAEHITVVAPGGTKLLDDVSLEVRAGELTGVMGANGAGKTTLFKVMTGLSVPSGGTVYLRGKSLCSYDATDRSRYISYVEQLSRVHWPLTVEMTVALGRLPFLHKRVRLASTDRQAVDSAIKHCEIDYLRERKVDTLSGGELTRVLLARAMATEAPVMLADEPMASLDPHHQLHVMELLKVRSQTGAAVMVTLHDLSLAARWCDRIIVLSHGHVRADGTPAEVLASNQLGKSYGIRTASCEIEGKPFIATLERIRAVKAS